MQGAFFSESAGDTVCRAFFPLRAPLRTCIIVAYRGVEIEKARNPSLSTASCFFEGHVDKAHGDGNDNDDIRDTVTEEEVARADAACVRYDRRCGRVK